MLVSTITLALSLGFSSIVSGSPVPQYLDFESLDEFAPIPSPTIIPNAVAQVVTVDEAKLIAVAVAAPLVTPDSTPDAKVKRQTSSCAVQPLGYGPAPTTDNAESFLAYVPFADAANGAGTPAPYTQTFKNLQASVNGYGYLGYTTLKTYDVDNCAARCNAITNCAAFNIYFERDPTVDPGTSCPNPPSTTQIKCAFWGGPITANEAVNNGQYRRDFHVVIAGSNGYVNYNKVAPPGYTTPTFLDNAAILAPLCADGSDPYLGYKLFNDGAGFSVERCAAACTAQAASGFPQKCSFFNTYILLKNGEPKGQYCSLYSATFDKSYAKNFGQYDQQGNHYTITYSYSSSNAANPGGCV